MRAIKHRAAGKAHVLNPGAQDGENAMSDIRYLVETIPSEKVTRILKKNGAKHCDSVWDFVDQSYLTEFKECSTEDMAWRIAKKVLPDDEFREIRIVQQVLVEDEDGASWEDDQIAYIYDDTDKLEWAYA